MVPMFMAYNWRLIETVPTKINLLTLISHIERQPDEAVDMQKWVCINRNSESIYEAVQPGCGTAACAAGHAWLVMQLQQNPNMVLIRFQEPKFGRLGCSSPKLADSGLEIANWLGFSERVATNLFFGMWHTVPGGSASLDTLTRDRLLHELRYLYALPAEELAS